MKSDPYVLNEYDCGCRIVSEFKGGLGFKIIKWCELHKNAEQTKKELDKAKRKLKAHSVLSGSPRGMVDFCRDNGLEYKNGTIESWHKAIMEWSEMRTT
jgi:hypothetical protein